MGADDGFAFELRSGQARARSDGYERLYRARSGYRQVNPFAQRAVVDPSLGVYGFDIAPGVWHGSLVLEPGTVVFEVKPGPYVPVGAVDLAPWTPAADDAEAVGRFLAWLREQVPPSE